MQVGFIGIGRMGSGMAANLFAAGHTLTVYNRSRPRLEPLVGKGAALAARRRAAARGDVVITMLADDAPSSSRVRRGGILERLRPVRSISR